MSKQFAEQVLDTIYAKAIASGHGSECSISRKQYDIVSEYLEAAGVFPDGTVRCYFGNVGKYSVTLNDLMSHGCICSEITLRDEAEVEAERKAEEDAKAQLDAFKAGFEAGSYVGQPKKRIDFVLTLASQRVFDGYYGRTSIYEFADENGNCIVWFTGNVVECYDEESDQWVYAEVGDKVTMRATVKEHSEYKGIKQTVITRPKIAKIAKCA